MIVDEAALTREPALTLEAERSGGTASHSPFGGTASRSLSLYASWKSAAEYVAAAILFIVTAPIVLVTIIVVRLTSRGPAIYSQTRLGRDGRPFTIYKIRSMVHECEAKTGPCWSSAGDSRVTRVGRFLRASHLDELPQLYNILRGEMSLIGPRPERPEIVSQLERAITRYRDRLAVRPGVTGLAQVRLPPDTDLESVRRKLVCDLYYIHHLSLWLDLRILCCTAFGVLGIPHAASRNLLQVPSPLDSSAIVGEIISAQVRAPEIVTQVQAA